MDSILKILRAEVSSAFQACGYEGGFGAVNVSDRQDLCQFQSNDAFACAKVYRKRPFSIAEEVAAQLARNPMFAKAEAVNPGFVNISLSDAYLVSRLTVLAEDAHLGIPQAQHPETIVFDYGGANVAKPLHIGHLRPAVIGEALKRLARATGRTLISDVHLGDWGLPIGLVMAELAARYPNETWFTDTFDADHDAVPTLDADMLNEIYPFASAKSKEDTAFRERAQQFITRFQRGEAGPLAMWREIMRVSVPDLKQGYGRLGVDFDYWYGESNAEKYVPVLLDRLREKSLLRESEGALVVDVKEDSDKAPMPPVIVKSSNGANMYATTDLATIIQRQEDFKPTSLWYMTDNRQSLHFEQIFRATKKAGLVPEGTELAFLGIGTMNGADGKPFKTRDGGVMRLSEFLDTAVQAAAQKLSSSDYAQDADRAELAHKIGIAAIKFGDLSNHRAKDYVFDLDKFLSFEGKTGSYLLYTVTRITSILQKAGVRDDAPLRFNGLYTDAERAMILGMLLGGEAFAHAVAEKAPNYICDNAYRLASAFSAFYHDNYIVTESDPAKRETWLSLCILTKRLLLAHLDVLGIEAVERM